MSHLRRRGTGVVAALAVLAAAAGVAARADTSCALGGPTPGVRALRLDLPQGSDVVDLRLSGVRTTRPVSDRRDWHLVQGLFVLDAATHALLGYRIADTGTAPRRVVVRSGGTGVVDQAATLPDGPFSHTAGPPITSLPPGSYDVVGFGSDGSPDLPNEWWSATVKVGGVHSCVIEGSGTVFDDDQTSFSGGTELAGYGAGDIDGASLAFTVPTAVSLVVGVLDSSVQGAGTAQTDYRLPSGGGSVSDRIVPFVSGPGSYQFTAHAMGLYPIVDVAGAAITIP